MMGTTVLAPRPDTPVMMDSDCLGLALGSARVMVAGVEKPRPAFVRTPKFCHC